VPYRDNVKTLASHQINSATFCAMAPGKGIRFLPAPRLADRAAFTLVEVVVALGIFSFALVAIVGLFVVGLNTNKESSDQIQEANFASLLISSRRALPTSLITNFALPPLNAAYSAAGTFLTNSTGVAADGTTNTTTANVTPVYNLFYQVGTNFQTGANPATGAHLALVHLIIWSPLGAAFPTNNPGARYELSTQVALP
jgi:uncharacterized protein (TIGR02598 family)